jgi:hypothetical protein
MYQLWYKKAFKTLQMYMHHLLSWQLLRIYNVLAYLLKFIMNDQEDLEPEMF